jgi:hypothetical protein
LGNEDPRGRRRRNGQHQVRAALGLPDAAVKVGGDIAGWKSKLADDPMLIVKAASAAERAAKWIRGERYG